MSELESQISDVSHPGSAAESGRGAGAWASFVAATQFLTRLPIATTKPPAPAALYRSPVFFPLVGGLIGIVTAIFIGAGSFVWPIWLAVLVALSIEMWLTGALHEDGVADFCDAFGGGWTREEILTILKDSRVGTYGVLGLLMAVALRAAATIEIVSRHTTENALLWGSALVAGSAIGRWAMVLAMFCVPPIARRESLAQGMARGLGNVDLIVASGMAMPFVALFAWFHPLRCLIGVLMVAPTVAWILLRVKQKLGGMTGDCLGLIGYVSQLLVLLAAAMRIDFWSTAS